MAFFKFRKGGGEPVSATASPAESVEVLRRRARQRLIGAAVLVLAGVIGFPLVFDSQPRPIAVDIPIDIPDRAAKPAKPGSAPAVAAAPASATGGEGVVARPETLAVASGPAPAFQPATAVATASPNAAGVIAPAAALAPAAASPAASAAPVKAAPVAPAPEAAKPAPAPAAAAAVASKAASVPARSAAPASSAKAATAATADASRARALLEGQSASAPAAAGSGRFVVQVGAFADAGKAQAARRKLEKAGLKTYTHVAETKEGKRIRVRVGPFESRSEADKAAAKVKGLDLSAAVLTL